MHALGEPAGSFLPRHLGTLRVGLVGPNQRVLNPLADSNTNLNAKLEATVQISTAAIAANQLFGHVAFKQHGFKCSTSKYELDESARRPMVDDDDSGAPVKACQVFGGSVVGPESAVPYGGFRVLSARL